jgi:hypothetical protein
MRNALLKAGLITKDESRKGEYEAEARRLLKIHERGSLDEETVDELAKRIAKDALIENTPLDKLTGLVIKHVVAEKQLRQKAEEQQNKQLALS